MNFKFLCEIIQESLSFYVIFSFYQSTTQKGNNIKGIFLTSILGVCIRINLFKILPNDSLYWGLSFFMIIASLLYILNFSKIKQILFYTAFITTFVFYIFIIISYWSRSNYYNDVLSVSDYISALILFVFVLALLKNILKFKIILPKGRISLVILFTSLSLLILELLYFEQLQINLSLIEYKYNMLICIIGILFFCYNIIVQYLYNDYHQLTMISRNNFISKITDSYINGIQKEQEKVYKIKHDIKNNLIILQHLINDDQIEDANKVLQEISQNLEYKKSDIYTGNIFIDAYLTNIINTSKIDIQIKCSDLKEMHYKPDVLSIIINLVDNAVENALSKVELYIKYEDKNNILIKVSNDCENDPTKLLKKSKKKGDHGYGLRIVKDIVNKYKGTYLTSYENYIFTTYVMINIGDENEK